MRDDADAARPARFYREGILSPSRTAVLIIDVQNDFVHENGRLGSAGADVSPLLDAVRHTNQLIATARPAGVKIVYVRVEHGPHVDLAPYRARYERRGMSETDTICHEGTWGADFHPALTSPDPGDACFVKHGYDAFQVSALEECLRQSDIETVVVTGVVTELCVRATAMSAFEKGFHVVVPPECTASTEVGPASAALESLRRWYAELLPLSMLAEAWLR